MCQTCAVSSLSEVFMLIEWCCVWQLPQQPNFPREQLQNAFILYLPSLQSGDIYATTDYTPRWVKLQHVCRADWLLRVPETSCFSNICSSYFSLHLLHLVAFAEQNTDYHSIFIIISRGTEAELFGVSDSET